MSSTSSIIFGCFSLMSKCNFLEMYSGVTISSSHFSISSNALYFISKDVTYIQPSNVKS